MNPSKQQRAAQLYSAGQSVADIARELNVPTDYAWAFINGGQIAELQRSLGLTDDGKLGRKTMAELRDLIRSAAPPATVPTGSSELRSVGEMSLGERALDWCLVEARIHGDRQVPEARFAEYLSGCTRDGELIGDWLERYELSKPGRQFAFCAAAQGYAEHQVAIGDDRLPPWRAGALEIRTDAMTGLRPGERWLPLPEVIAGTLPRAGDIAVYQNTTDATRGHVERVWQVTHLGFKSVGANENNGRWVIDNLWIGFSEAGKSDGTQRLKLLGFCARVG